eukprot:TRINITY_DN2478_c0_g3_i2.p1 TRINITY_DN2478_c0_g3~~TRINITY_DN2478_c0_g3_i2.p1  ORF type:complete len:492 (+),score=129.11 TRINITY_DN2478_c0_g3_i2:933-2408(+)
MSKKPRKQDDRFDHQSDLRFKSLQKATKTVEPDARFAADFSDSDASIDIRGRNVASDDESSDSEVELTAEGFMEESDASSILETDEETKRLAVMNCDWDNVKSTDILVLLQSFVPAGGSVKRVSIYPSHFGLERMQRENEHGPILHAAGNDAFNGSDDGADDDGDNVVQTERIRKYELEKLKYYFGVIECDSVQTASVLYRECDGLEFERSGTVMDLRFIPDSEQIDTKARDSVTDLPANYAPPEFEVKALGATNVKLTWDETPRERTKQLQQDLRKVKDSAAVDFSAYLASSSSDSGQEELDDKKRRKKKALRKKLKGLLEGMDDQRGSKEGNMEITFTPGLADKAQSLVNGKREEKQRTNESSWDAYVRKREEKAKARKAKARGKSHGSDDSDSEIDMRSHVEKRKADQLIPKPAKEEKKQKKSKQQRKLEKEAKLKADGFQVDVTDTRFGAMFDRPDFAIDRTAPQFKDTPATQQLLRERLRRNAAKE